MLTLGPVPESPLAAEAALWLALPVGEIAYPLAGETPLIVELFEVSVELAEVSLALFDLLVEGAAVAGATEGA
jgi:hypothetical protein